MNMNTTTFLITGAGSGIGRAIAQVIVKNNPNADLILVGRNTTKLSETLKSLDSPRHHQFFQTDLRNKDSIQSLRQELQKQKVSLNGLILNAGIGGANEYGEKDRWDEVLATNLTGPYLMVQELLPLMKSNPNEFKSIVFISSVLARLGIPKYSAYCASKAGLLGLMRSLAAELASEKILVNAICPGWVDTEMSSEGLRDLSQATGKPVDAILKAQMSVVPLRKMSAPAEVGELVNFLISNVQASITGQALDINNGALMV